MRVGLLHLGQSVDFVVSIIFLRSPVFAILAIGSVFLLVDCLCSHLQRVASGFNGAAMETLAPETDDTAHPTRKENQLALPSLYEKKRRASARDRRGSSATAFRGKTPFLSRREAI
jgi:hypothetical protein